MKKLFSVSDQGKPKGISWIFLFRLAIGLGLILFLIFSIGPQEFLQTLSSIKPAWGLLALFSSFLLFFISNLNVWILLRGLHPIPYRKFFKHYLHGYIVTLLAPGQMGDASITLFLKKEGIPIRQSVVVYLLDKTMTLLVFLSVSALGAGFISPQLNTVWIKLIPVTGFIVFWGGLFFSLQYSKYLSAFPRARRWLEDSRRSLEILRRQWHLLLLNMSLSLLKWLTVSCSYFCAFLAYQTFVPWPAIGIIPVLSSLAGYIPLSLGGIGITEMTAVHLFALEHVDKPVVLSAYIFLRMLQFFIAGIIFLCGKVFWMDLNHDQ